MQADDLPTGRVALGAHHVQQGLCLKGCTATARTFVSWESWTHSTHNTASWSFPFPPPLSTAEHDSSPQGSSTRGAATGWEWVPPESA